jgi:dihydroneopterin aldolase
MNKTSSLTKLTIRNLEFYAYHGVRSEEQALGGKFQVDIELWYNDKAAVLSDNVKNALNYEEVVFTLDEIMNGDPFNLVETLSYEMMSGLMEKFPLIERVAIRVRKLNVPIRHIVDYIEVEQSMSRDAG